MFTKLQKLQISLFPLAIVVCFILATRNPYDSRFFTLSTQEFYTSPDVVIEHIHEAWSLDSREKCNIWNEAYGMIAVKKPVTQTLEWPGLDSIHYYKCHKLAVAKMNDGGVWWPIFRQNRWVLYPETPWLIVLEMMNS